MAETALLINNSIESGRNSSSVLNGTATSVAPAEDIWSKILQEANTKNSKKIQASDDKCGKSSLIKRLTNNDHNNFNSVLEYNYLTVQATDPDGSYAYQLATTGLGLSAPVNLPLWILDGKDELAPLLKFAFPSQQLAKCVLVLCVSLEQPSNIMPSLRKWYRVFEEQVRNNYSKDEIEQARQARKLLLNFFKLYLEIRFWQEYVEPIESSMHGDSAGHLQIDPFVVEIEDGVLIENCGAPVIVVITKSDTFVDVSTDLLNKIQYQVRQFCLAHGAALFYTSAKEEKNTHLLYKYLAHRIYSLPFTTPGYIVENDSIFVPSGWDSKAKLEIINVTNPEVEILSPQDPIYEYTKAGKNGDLDVCDEQAFLLHLVSLSASDSGTTVNANRGTESPPIIEKDKTSTKKTETTNDHTVLASFFNNLLSNNKANKTSSMKPLATSSPLPVNNTGDSSPRLSDMAQPVEGDEDLESDISSAGSTLPTPRDTN